MNVLEILIGQIPEAIYFALFMIFTKGYKTNRMSFIGLMVLEYLLLKQVFVYSIWFQILYFVLSYLLMKILYDKETHITDVFTMCIASIFLIVISAISYLGSFGNMMICSIASRILMFVLLLSFRHLLPKIDDLYKKLWNRSENKYKMKSTTFRALNVVIFNVSFVLINLGLMFVSMFGR